MSNPAGAQLEAATLWPTVYRTEVARHATGREKQSSYPAITMTCLASYAH